MFGQLIVNTWHTEYRLHIDVLSNCWTSDALGDNNNHFWVYISNFVKIRAILRKIWQKRKGDPHLKIGPFHTYHKSKFLLFDVFANVIYIHWRSPLVHNTLNKHMETITFLCGVYIMIFDIFSIKIYGKEAFKLSKVHA